MKTIGLTWETGEALEIPVSKHEDFIRDIEDLMNHPRDQFKQLVPFLIAKWGKYATKSNS